MKSVLFLSHTSELNGAELWLLQFLTGLNRSKFNPLLVVPYPGPLADCAQTAGVQTVLIPFKWWLTEKVGLWKQPLSWLWNARSVLRLARLIEERKVDAVVSNSAASFSGALAAKAKAIPHIWAVHEILGKKKPQLSFLLGQRILIRLIQSLSCKVVISSRATGLCFGESEKVRLVYSGVDLPTGDLPDPKVFRTRFNLSEDDVVLGMVGRICNEKGQREMIQALGLLSTDYPRLKLLLAGGVKDKNYLSSLQKIIERENLGNRVIFAGFQKDIISLLDALDCLVVASKMESFGRTIIEAMAVRTPVIAVRSGGIPEIITSGENGLLLDSRKPEELKKAIISFFHDQAAFQRAADEGVETVKKGFLLQNQIHGIESVLEECLGQS
ncbi:glycosyltransferase family 4 protein [Acidobacteriota bacterium]